MMYWWEQCRFPTWPLFYVQASQDFKGQAVQMPGDAVAAAAAGQFRQDAEKRQMEKAYVWDQEALIR